MKDLQTLRLGVGGLTCISLIVALQEPIKSPSYNNRIVDIWLSVFRKYPYTWEGMGIRFLIVCIDVVTRLGARNFWEARRIHDVYACVEMPIWYPYGHSYRNPNRWNGNRNFTPTTTLEPVFGIRYVMK